MRGFIFFAGQQHGRYRFIITGSTASSWTEIIATPEDFFRFCSASPGWVYAKRKAFWSLSLLFSLL